MNVMALLKAGRQSLPKNAIPALMESLGMKADVTEVSAEHLFAAFQSAVRDAQRNGAQVLRLAGTMPDGSEIHSLMIFGPARPVQDSAAKKVLTAGGPVVL